MSADNFLLVRKHKGGWLVNMEFLSNDEPMDIDKAYFAHNTGVHQSF